MSTNVYVAHSHAWLHSRLLEHAVIDPHTVKLVERRRDAELIVFPIPPLPDPDARDSLRNFHPRDLIRTFVYSQTDDPIPWAPGMYASLTAARASSAFTGGFYIAHHHLEPGGLFNDLEAARESEPNLLWSFMGTVSNHPIRQRLVEVEDDLGLSLDTQTWSEKVRWGWKSEYRTEGRAAFADYASMLGRSTFVVCPRGRGASSIRIFEALQTGRCPVIISDDWLPPPFVDWDSCSIRIPEAKVGELPALLRARQDDAETLGQEARRVWERFFSPERQLDTLISACLAIADSSPRRLTTLTRALVQPHTLHQGLIKIKQRLA